MSKDWAGAIKKISSIVQSAAPCPRMAADICAQYSAFTGADILLTEAYGKLIAQTAKLYRLRESVDGLYIDSRIADYLREVGIITCIQIRGGDSLNLVFNDESICRQGIILPLYFDTERIATIMACRETPFDSTDIDFLEIVGTIIVLVLGFAYSAETSSKQRDTESVKLALGNLSYSELAAILHVFRKINGEGLIVATHIADKLRIARSVVVNALRKLEGAGIIETRSLGVKGTHINVLNNALLEELYKIRG